MWQCVTVSATSEGGQQYFWVFVWAAIGTDSVFDLNPLSATLALHPVERSPPSLFCLHC